ncbi:MAG: hypothetical protein NTW72_04420 [Gemmatimonadetes bacterium]|nr:hypothetical protein [Gemmatimonadota bacterium]
MARTCHAARPPRLHDDRDDHRDDHLPAAVYYNPDADSLGTEGWMSSRAKALPTVSTVYPTVNYRDAGGILSSAETISFFVRADATTSRTDDYVMYRRVNDRDSTVIARNLIVPVDTAYFFKYWRTAASGALTAITAAQLPIYWNTAGGWADSIRTIDMRVSSLYREARTQRDVLRTVYSSTRLLNAGWTKSLEETAGERDVSLYVVAKHLLASSEWVELRNVPANNSATYSWDDFDFSSGTWVYGVYAQDCNPSNSSYTLSGNVVVP